MSTIIDDKSPHVIPFTLTHLATSPSLIAFSAPRATRNAASCSCRQTYEYVGNSASRCTNASGMSAIIGA